MNKRRQGPELFRAIAEFTYDWESWIDSRGRLAWVNAAVERMTGYTADECMRLPRYPLSIVHEEDRKRIRAALAGARRGSSGNDVEFRVVQRNGAIRWLAISWQPLVYEGARYGYRTSVRDID
ncbi:MAG TPA: PAS domain-containing protein, partial [Labilithrix sp.]|nr:PAS domain-containing protein [Labilithrix sp.]